MQSFSKLRNNLTIIYTLVTAGITIIIAVLLWLSMSISIESNAGSTLEVTAQQLAGTYDLINNLSNSESGAEAKNTYNELKATLAESQMTFDIWNDDLEIADNSDSQPIGKDILFSFIQKYFSERRNGALQVSYTENNLDLKVCTYAYVSQSGTLTIVQVTKDLEAERSVLLASVPYIVCVIIAGLCLSAIGGFFLADASHELRTPVTVIQTNLEVLRDNKEESVESQIEWIDNAYNETKRMKDIVENLLFLAKADAGERIRKFEPVDLSYLIMGITERLQGLADKKDIVLSAEIEAAELFVNGDEKRLTELITILIDNAVKYTNPGGSVTVIAQEEPDKVKVTVADTGIGIPADQIDKIFQRFYRVDKAHSREVGGTGLGLSIARWIVEEHRAEIAVTSVLGEGTKFILTFPAFKPGDPEFKSEE